LSDLTDDISDILFVSDLQLGVDFQVLFTDG